MPIPFRVGINRSVDLISFSLELIFFPSNVSAFSEGGCARSALAMSRWLAKYGNSPRD